jgi:hypothetical protein
MKRNKTLDKKTREYISTAMRRECTGRLCTEADPQSRHNGKAASYEYGNIVAVFFVCVSELWVRPDHHLFRQTNDIRSKRKAIKARGKEAEKEKENRHVTTTAHGQTEHQFPRKRD